MKMNARTISRVLTWLGAALVVIALLSALAGSFEGYKTMVESFQAVDAETGKALISPNFLQSALMALVSVSGYLLLAGLVAFAVATLCHLGIKEGSISIFNNSVLCVFSASCIFPLVWMFYSSLKEKRTFNADIMGLPTQPTLINYERILTNKDYHLAESMWNSVRTTALSIFLIVLFSFIVGYILSRVKFKGNRVLYVMFLMGMLIPIHSLLVPIYVVFKDCGINDKWYTLLLPYVSFGLPMGIFLVEGYVKSIPISLEEAAAIDGSSFSKTLWQIILPICKPILITVAIIQVFSCWNEFSFALVLMKSVNLQTVPLALTQFKGQFASDYPKQMAAMLLTMSPIVILYFVFSKHIIKGMVAGAVKG
ncbi:MAG: carbohydrate ABC transporter permease [Clostridiales bacterium]|nr:carbohydrate ABC transporter permease [Clostridiales bacterium]